MEEVMMFDKTRPKDPILQIKRETGKQKSHWHKILNEINVQKKKNRCAYDLAPKQKYFTSTEQRLSQTPESSLYLLLDHGSVKRVYKLHLLNIEQQTFGGENQTKSTHWTMQTIQSYNINNGLKLVPGKSLEWQLNIVVPFP